jgi:catechol 2,3-dioxygenase-like lactoylglutathione lyase family enzyme
VADPQIGIAEIVLWMHDMDRGLAFYRDLIGLEVFSPVELAVRFLRSPGSRDEAIPQMIVLVPHPDPASFPEAKMVRPLHHLAFRVDADSFEFLSARCVEAGLDVRGGVHPVLKDVRTFYVDDPEGNEVEIIAPVA